MKNNYETTAVLKAKNGKREKLQEELLKLINPTRKEEGCLKYTLFEDKNQAGTFYMQESFKDYEAFKVHIDTAHFKNFASQKNELLLEPVQLIELQQVSD